MTSLDFGIAAPPPALVSLEHFDEGTYKYAIGYPDMPVVTVFANLPAAATKYDVLDVLSHLQQTGGFRIPSLYVDIVTNMYDQRVILIRVPR